MITEIVLTLALISASMSAPAALISSVQNKPIATHEMSLEKRYGNTYVNNIFKDNILLTLAYIDGRVTSKAHIDWNEVEKPFHSEFSLNPGQEFTFHDQVLPTYRGNIVKTTNAHFNYTDGFKSDGYLMGDGVCHLASIIYWAAKDAGLNAYAPSNHNFAVIPEVPREYGVSIFVRPDLHQGANNNLYITNNKEKPVKFVFDYKDSILTVSVVEG